MTQKEVNHKYFVHCLLPFHISIYSAADSSFFGQGINTSALLQCYSPSSHRNIQVRVSVLKISLHLCLLTFHLLC